MKSNVTSTENDRAEAALARALAALPERSAPPELQARVFAALDKRASTAWWRLPIAQWPPLTRLGVMTACLLALLPLWQLSTEFSAWLVSLRHSAAIPGAVGGLQGMSVALRTLFDALVGRTPSWLIYSAASASVCSVLVCAVAGLWMTRGLRLREYAL